MHLYFGEVSIKDLPNKPSLVKIFLSLFLILTGALSSFAQEDNFGKIDAQRPTLTESFSIIRPNMLQFENGLDYFSGNDTLLAGSFFRGSIGERFELRGFTDYTNLNAIGAKFLAMHADSTQLGIGASFVYSRELLDDSDDFRIAMTKSLERLFFTYNFGYNETIYTIILAGVTLSNSVNYFVEYYNDPELNRIHSGVTWIPHQDIQLDINGGWLDSDEWYGGIGLSFRLR